MSLITTIPDTVFPGEVDLMEFSGTAGASLTFVLELDGERLLDTSFYYDSNGCVKIEGLGDLIEPYVMDGALHTLAVQGDGSYVKSGVTVLPCSLDNSYGAAAFIEHCFLSTCRLKTTYPGAKEYVSVLLCSAEDMTILRTWLQDGQIVHDSATQHLSVGLHTVDVSPASMDGRLLIDYEVRVGMRRCLFQLCHDTDSDPVSVIFRNAFGQLETFHFFGVQEKEVKPTRSSAMVSGVYRNYKVENIPTWKTTGRVIFPDEVLLAEDLVSSLYLERCSDGCPLVITESELKPDNNRFGVNHVSVTWREERTARRFLPSHKVKTFDATFDDSFV